MLDQKYFWAIIIHILQKRETNHDNSVMYSLSIQIPKKENN